MNLEDVWGNIINFSDERKSHILEHPEMNGQDAKIAETIIQPDIVIQSHSDQTVRIFHRLYKRLSIGDKHLCVVVKYIENHAFIITAYFTDKVKNGEIIWKK